MAPLDAVGHLKTYLSFWLVEIGVDRNSSLLGMNGTTEEQWETGPIFIQICKLFGVRVYLYSVRK